MAWSAAWRARRRAQGIPLSAGNKPNDLWCADFKGEFRLGNSRYCYPLTVTDHASRFLLLCEVLDSVREQPAIAAFQCLFAERGLMKRETTRPAGMNSLQQQARFDAFVEEFNTEGPHEALKLKRPADAYVPSARPCLGLPELQYPLLKRTSAGSPTP